MSFRVRIPGGGVAIVLGLAWLGVAWRVHDRADPSKPTYAVGDWLINYQGGLVRRGLLGELIFQVTTDAATAYDLVAVVQLALLALLYVCVVVLFLRSTRSIPWHAAVLSPAFLLFPFLSFDGGLRKELLALAALALLAVLLTERTHPLLLLVPISMFIVAAFSHESAVFVLPAYVFVVTRAARSRTISIRLKRVLLGVIGGIAVTSIAASVWFHGSADLAADVCESWINRGAVPSMCDGAIAHLDDSMVDGVRYVARQFPAYFAYLPLALVALVPFVAVRLPRDFWVLVGITYVALVPLFLVGIDYGRWIYVATSVLSIVALFAWGTSDHQQMRTPAYAALLFVTMWNVPHSGIPIQEPLYGQVLEPPFQRVLQAVSRPSGQ